MRCLLDGGAYRWRGSTYRNLFLLAVFSGAAASKVTAQEAGDTLSRATVCERAERSIQGGKVDETYYTAVSNLPNCKAAGARVLRAQWQQPPSDTVAVRLLGEVTPRLRDRQVFDAVLTTFRDPHQPRNVRLAALEALMGYYQPGLGASFPEPEQPVQHGSAYVMMGAGDPPTTQKGPSALTVGVRAEILEALGQVGKQDPDERVRLISAYIQTRLATLK